MAFYELEQADEQAAIEAEEAKRKAG